MLFLLDKTRLFEALQKIPNVQVQIVVFDKTIPFLKQIEITHNSDIFIGMHGAGLTHMLFLPEWAAVFELFNCGDVNCYLDLARLKGVKYFTWKNEDLIKISGDGTHPTLKTPHKKFNNYAFDSNEFVQIVKKMIEHVKRHPEFVEEQRRLRRLMKSEL
uniref:EGF domain-specific O-linked N-acetylglucosamine transferase n=1 Tax=Panagrolaimus sp. JU765 TaxID=591449 RepID=A0AC34QA07_9BILA